MRRGALLPNFPRCYDHQNFAVIFQLELQAAKASKEAGKRAYNIVKKGTKLHKKRQKKQCSEAQRSGGGVLGLHAREEGEQANSICSAASGRSCAKTLSVLRCHRCVVN